MVINQFEPHRHAHSEASSPAGEAALVSETRSRLGVADDVCSKCSTIPSPTQVALGNYPDWQGKMRVQGRVGIPLDPSHELQK